MTSEERKEGRYQRRRAGREAKRRARSEVCGSFEQVLREPIGLQLSEKKTRILPIRQGVRFLKTKFKLTQTGGVIRKVQRKSTRKMRQKLRKFRRWVDDGRMTEEDVRTSYESWKGHMRRGNSWKVLRKTDKLYRKLFGEKGDHQCTKFGRTGA